MASINLDSYLIPAGDNSLVCDYPDQKRKILYVAVHRINIGTNGAQELLSS
jgi:hypothetical protein